jgi:lipopolysaccharide/colanic/teichoic acid biosynthesis glycosyltransferase
MEQATRQQTVRAAAPVRRSAGYGFNKRLLDAVGSVLGLVVLSPVFALIAAVIWVDSGFPIIYKCQRLGQGGRQMTVFKFRTMYDGSHHHLEELLSADEERRLIYETNRKLRDDPRRTRVGAILRRTSLDELPQLWNVMRGDMSLVGPRPYMVDELDGIPQAGELLSVKPGITGLWQVSGRSDLTFEQRVALEIEYIRRRSLAFDLQLIGRTIGAVLSGRGAY